MQTHAPARPERAVTVDQLRWLEAELTQWCHDGILSDTQAGAIRQRYHTVATARRFSLGRLLLGLGAAFVGVGLIWLVAANLDELSPLVRFGAVAAIWLVLLAGGEATAGRAPGAITGAVRLLAALAFGAVVFQAAQSLQVPAWAPHLVGLWGLGALVHAYAARAVAPLAVGVAAGTGWWVWQSLWEAPTVLGAVVALGAAAVVAAAVAVLHGDLPAPVAGGRASDSRFADTWRVSAGLLVLGTLFLAAFPSVGSTEVGWTPWLVGAVVVAAVLAAATAVRATGTARLEAPGAILLLGLAVLLVLWDTGTKGRVDAADWAHAGLSVTVYVVAAVGVAALGILRDLPALTGLAMAGLVVFTTVQSFAVFAAIIQGAWLFVVLGLVFLGTGMLVERARRRLVEALDEEGSR